MTDSPSIETQHGHPGIVLATLSVANVMALLDLFVVNVALHDIGVGLHYLLVQDVNRFRVPVVSYAGAGNHVVNGSMHEQVQTVTGMLAEAGCRRVEFWTRANTWLSPFAFSVYDILDPVGMITRFRDPYDRAAQRIASRAPAETARLRRIQVQCARPALCYRTATIPGSACR